jgi:hypothetical protein
MRRILLLALAVSLTLSTSAQKKKVEQRELPDRVLVAQFVYVTGWHGGVHDFRTPPEEKSAILRVEAAVHEWGRYRLVLIPGDADLMLVVKPGHLGMMQGGVNVGGGPDVAVGTPPFGRSTSPAGTGVGYGVEAGSPDDFLMLSLSPNIDPIHAPYIWKSSSSKGLQGRKIPLFEDLRRAVVESDKAMAASKKP